jgi:hypothetical protein
MVSFNVAPRQDQVKRALRELGHIQSGAPRALSAALNKTATGAKTDTVRILSKAYTVKQKDLREAISVGKKASPSSLTASVLGRYVTMPLSRFSIRPRSIGKKRPRGGITATVKRGESKKIKSAFIVMVGAKPLVMMRAGAKRLPIKKLYGPSIPYMMDNDGVAEQVMKLAQARLDKNLDHEIARIEKGFGK